jgi:replicative DNA helicase
VTKIPRIDFVFPANLEAERCVLGAVIDDASFLPKVMATGLRCDDFMVSDHRRIFQAIELLYGRGIPVDFVTVAEELGNRNEDYAAIAALTFGVVLYEDHILHHAKIVGQKAQLRELLKIGEWIARAVTETGDPDAVIAELRARLHKCSEGRP